MLALSLLHCRPVDRRSDFPRFSVPPTAFLRLAPHEASCSSRSGSTLGFSQPLSGFLAHPSFAALFRAATVPGILPFRAFPSQGSRAPLEAALLPCRYPPTCRTVLPVCLIATRFTDSRAFDAVAWIPRATMDSLFTNRSLLPGCPGLRAAESIHSASFTDFEASIPSRIRSRPVRVAPTWRPLLLGFFPSTVFSVHASRPLPAQASRT